MLDRARFDVVATTVDDTTTVGGLARTLGAAVEALADRVGDRVLVVRLDVDGTGGVHAALARPGATDELLAAVRDRLGGRDRVVVTGIEDRTAPAPDEVDPRLARLLDAVDDDRVVAPGLAVAEERGWSASLGDADELVRRARAAATSWLSGAP